MKEREMHFRPRMYVQTRAKGKMEGATSERAGEEETRETRRKREEVEEFKG